MHGCSLGSWTPLDNDKVTKKVDVSVRTWVRNLGLRCSVSLSGYFTEAFITSKASVLTLYKDVVRRSVRKWRPPCDFYSFRTIRVWVVWRFSWKAASSRCPCFRHTLYSTVHVVCLNWRLWWSWQMMESWNQVVKKWEKHRSRWGSRGNGGKGLSLRMEFIS